MHDLTTHDTIPFVPSSSAHQPPATPATETHSAAALRLVLQALAEHGCDLEAETAALGLSLDEVRNIEGRIPRSAYCALWQRLADITSDPDCGLHLACRLPTGALGVIEYVACNAPTLGEGHASIARYGPLLHDAGTHHFTIDGDIARFCYRAPTSPPSPRALIDWAFAYMIAAGRRGVQTDFPLRHVRMQYPPANRYTGPHRVLSLPDRIRAAHERAMARRLGPSPARAARRFTAGPAHDRVR